MSPRIWITTAMLLLAAVPLWGQERDDAKAALRRQIRNPKRELPSYTPEREAAALTFVKLHHPELGEVLKNLKDSGTEEYHQAIRELFGTSENLARTRDRDPELYEYELEERKVNSRIQLLAARLRMGPDAALEKQLRQALEKSIDIRLDRLKAERAKLEQRLKQIDRTEESIERNRDQQLRSRFKRLLRGEETTSAE